LATEGALDVRARIAAHELAPLATSLAADLEPLLSRDIHIPSEKAVLSREGGRCARDGTMLAFDPFEPHEHRCPMCGTVYRGEWHDRFWIYWYQLWLAERAVHAAALSRLGVDNRFGALAARILEGYVERYDRYPNRDNVLGPTRLFFSTYLESIWLLQLCVAVDLIDGAAPSLANRVRDRVVAPSRAIIAEYDEGDSNRQVWNDAALLAAARLLGDEGAAEAAVRGPSGIESHLSRGLLSDGTWFEGENYHLFAHRGLWYGVTLAEAAGMELPAPLLDRFQRGFTTPFATSLPDLTLPSRRDSQYAISLRQWRIAEHCELGLARSPDAELLGALERLYASDIPRRGTGRSTSSADVERNAPPSALTRADLSWRALLFARPTLPDLVPAPLRSTLLAEQGIAVFRRDHARAYVALDYGHSGGGHGHPDRLNLLLSNGALRWLDDFGTGSYVDPSLRWYRSTLAHNAPLFDGTSQRRVNGRLVAYDERDGAGWIVAAADDVAEGVNARRTLVVMEGYLVDVVAWDADHAATVDLPLHANVALFAGVDELTPALLPGGIELEDGFDFVRDAAVQSADSNVVVHGSAAAGDASQREDELRLWAQTSARAEWWRAVAPGPPTRGDQIFRVVRTSGHRGRHVMVLDWSGSVADVDIGDEIRVTLADGASHSHRGRDDGWWIDRVDAGSRDTVQLRGYIDTGERVTSAHVELVEPGPGELTLTLPRSGEPLTIALGDSHYRRSELPWADAGKLEAYVTLQRQDDELHVSIAVPRSHRLFAAADAVNLYDNEHPDINGDGVQLYLHDEHGPSAWMLVPEPGGDTVRRRPIDGWAPAPERMPPLARWRASENGYAMEVRIPAPLPDAFDVIVNVTSPGRERREAQLVLSGAAGEFVYLRGDRHERARLLRLRRDD
jgi:hypothetical protein